LNGEVLLTSSYLVGVLTKLKQRGSLNADFIETIREKIQVKRQGLKIPDKLKFVYSSKSVPDLFGKQNQLERSTSQPIIPTSNDIDVTTGESHNSSSESNQSGFEGLQHSSIRTIDTSPSLSPPPPPSISPPQSPQQNTNTQFFIKRSSHRKKHSRSYK